jgi:hypothetical protein
MNAMRLLRFYDSRLLTSDWLTKSAFASPTCRSDFTSHTPSIRSKAECSTHTR